MVEAAAAAVLLSHMLQDELYRAQFGLHERIFIFDIFIYKINTYVLSFQHKDLLTLSAKSCKRHTLLSLNSMLPSTSLYFITRTFSLHKHHVSHFCLYCFSSTLSNALFIHPQFISISNSARHTNMQAIRFGHYAFPETQPSLPLMGKYHWVNVTPTGLTQIVQVKQHLGCGLLLAKRKEKIF